MEFCHAKTPVKSNCTLVPPADSQMVSLTAKAFKTFLICLHQSPTPSTTLDFRHEIDMNMAGKFVEPWLVGKRSMKKSSDTILKRNRCNLAIAVRGLLLTARRPNRVHLSGARPPFAIKPCIESSRVDSAEHVTKWTNSAPECTLYYQYAPGIKNSVWGCIKLANHEGIRKQRRGISATVTSF